MLSVRAWVKKSTPTDCNCTVYTYASHFTIDFKKKISKISITEWFTKGDGAVRMVGKKQYYSPSSLSFSGSAHNFSPVRL